METKVLEIFKKEIKTKTNNLSAKRSIKRYVSESVEYYSYRNLSEQDKNEIKNTLEEYVEEYIKDEARRLTYNTKCIKNGRQDKIKVKTNIVDAFYAIGFVVTFMWCWLSYWFK